MVTGGSGGSSNLAGSGTPGQQTPGGQVFPNNLPPPPDPTDPDSGDAAGKVSMQRRGAKPPGNDPVQEAPRRFPIGKRLPSLFARVEHPRSVREHGVDSHNVPPRFSR